MRRKFRKFFSRNSYLMLCVFFIIFLFFMSSGYSILNEKLNIKMTSLITEEEPWLPEVSFVNTHKMGNIFFYDIVIHNNSEFVYKDWKITMYNLDYIEFTDMLERRKTFRWMGYSKL